MTFNFQGSVRIGLVLVLLAVAGLVGSSAGASAQVVPSVTVDGFVADPVTGVVEGSYVAQGVTYTQDQATGEFAGLLYTAEDATSYYFAFAQSVHVNDNTYGSNGIGWESRKNGHTLKDLLQSDHMKAVLTDGNGGVVYDFTLDYATDDAKGRTIGNVDSLGVTGGDGSIRTGDPTTVTASSSLDWNFNNASPTFTQKTLRNPRRTPSNTYDSGTTADSRAPWIYEIVYEWSLPKAAFLGGIGALVISEVHNSPFKSGFNPVPIPVLNVRKTADPASGSTVLPGDIITYTVTVSNPGTTTVAGVVITDVVDENLGSIVPLDAGTYDANSRTVAWTIGDLTGGASASVRFQATVAPVGSVPDGGLAVYNLATITSPTLATSVNTNTTEHFVQPVPEITLVKTATPTNINPVSVGDEIVYVFTVTNSGSLPLADVLLTDDVEGILALSDVANDGVSFLDVGDTETVTFTHPVTQAEIDAGSLTNVATVTGADASGTTVSATDTRTVSFGQVSAIQVVKTASTNLIDPATAGATVTYTYTVSNIGNVTLTGVALEDDIEGVLLISDLSGDGATVLAAGDSETASSTHIVSQAEIDAGSLTNIATTVGTSPTGETVTDTDTQTVALVQHPTIEVVKIASNNLLDPIIAGGEVTYSYTITNTGNVTLTGVSLFDDVEGTLGLSTGTLAPNASTSTTSVHTITQAEVDAGTLTNVATVTGNPPVGSGVSDTDTQTVTLAQNPAIQIIKTASTNLIDPGLVGAQVTYTFTVTNTGNVTLTGVSLEDDVEGPLTLSDAAGDGTAALAVGDSEAASFVHTVTQLEIDAGSLTNVATATGTSPAGGSVTDTDDQTVVLGQSPAIQLTKFASPGVIDPAQVGDSINYSYVFTNTGNVTLTEIALVDDVEGTLALTTTTLAPGFSGTRLVVHAVTQAEIDAGLLTNVATVTGAPPAGSPVSDDDTQTVILGQDPSIQVVKTASTNLIDPANVGNQVTYSYTVSNTGNVTLTDISLVDDVEGALTLLTTTLAPSASTTASSIHTLTQTEIDAGSLTNVATANGTAPAGDNVTDTDTQTVVLGQAPSIQVVKTASTNLIDPAAAGNQVTYTYAVTNTGNVTLTSVGLLDDVEGTLTLSDIAGDGIGVIAVDASETASSVHTVTQGEIDAGSLTNVATANGTALAGGSVTDTDTQTVVLGQAPSIQVVKTASTNSIEAANVGDQIMYTFTVTNTGNVTLTSVSLEDDVEGIVTLGDIAGDGIAVLAPGNSEAGTSVHTITQGELDTGSLTNVATAVGTPPTGAAVSDTDTQTVILGQAPSIQVTKTASTNLIDPVTVGDQVTYSYTVSNTGNVTLTGVSLVDDVEGTLTITDIANDGVGVMAAGASETASITHSVNQAEIDSGSLTNVATATGTASSGTNVSDTDTQTVVLAQVPAIEVTKTASPNSGIVTGDTISYSYTVTNSGNVTLTSVSLVDDVEGIVVLVTTTLAPNDSTSVVLSHTVTQAEIDAGSLTNIATATGTPPDGVPVQDSDSVTIKFVNLGVAKSSTMTQVTLDATDAAMVSSDNGNTATTTLTDSSVVLWTEITYTITVTNSGDADATGVVLTDTLPTQLAVIGNPNAGTVSGNVVTWNIGTVAAGSSITVKIIVRT